MSPTPHRAPPTDHETGPALRAAIELFGREFAYNAEILPVIRTLRSETPDRIVAVTGFTHDGFEVDGVGGRISVSRFSPPGQVEPAPALVFVHGGGLVSGGRFGLDGIEELCRDLRLTFFTMEYRLAPEDPYPAALDDCTDTYEWVVRNAAELGVDPARLVLGGASAGGGIAAAVALRLRDRGGRLPLGLQLMSPMLDDRMQYASSEQCASGLVWSRESSRFAWSSYLRDVAGDVPYTAAPGRAVDLAGLPSTLIDVGDVDMFRDEDVAFASALWAGGVNCELHVWPAAFHGSDGMAPGAAVTRAAKAARIDWFRRRLAQPSIESASSAESPLD